MARKILSVENSLSTMRQAIARFRETDKTASAILVESFLLIASRPPSSMSLGDLAKHVDVSASAMNHIAARLSGGAASPRLGGEPLNLISVDADPLDGRRKVVALTARGRNLATAMSRDLVMITEEE